MLVRLSKSWWKGEIKSKCAYIKITSKLEAISFEAVSWFLKRQELAFEMQRIEATKKLISSEDVADGGDHDNWELHVEGDEDDVYVDDGELKVDDGDVLGNFVVESIGLGGRL